MSTLAVVILGLTFLGGLTCVGIIYVARDRTEVPGSRSFVIMTGVEAVWCFAYGLLLLATSEFGVFLFDAVQTICSVSTAFLWLVFVLEYTGNEQWLAPKWLAILWLEPVLYLSLYVTNPFHHLIVADPGVAEAVGLTYADGSFTLIALLQILVIYAVVVVSFGILARFILRSRNLYRKQTAIIFVGSFLITVGNLGWLVALATTWGIDLTPVFVAVRGAFVALALFRYDFLEVAPLASDTLIEEMNDPVLIVDDEDVLVDFNREAERTFGLDESQVGDGISGLLTEVVAAVESGDPVHVETTPARTNGGSRAVYQPSKTQLSDQHDIVRGELIVLRDITTQKRREEKLASLQAGSQELIGTASPEEVAAVTTEKATSVLGYPFVAVLLVDEAGEELSPASLSGPIVTELDGDDLRITDGVAWTAYEGEAMRVHDESALDDAGLGALPVGRMLLYPLGDHGLLCVGSKAADHFSEDDRRFAELLALTARSALDRAEREAELERRRAQLQERNERLDEFASIVSHDLRNPLNAAEGFLDLARENPDPELFDPIEESHDRMHRIIDDVLALAREGGEVDDTSAVSIESVALEAWDTAGPEAGRLVVERDARVRADEDRLRRLLENLFRNAREHASEDATVTVRADPDEGRFALEDDGPGIDPEDREAVFDQGYTTADEGTGFGLSIVRRIAKAHGWTVSLADGADGGARFVFEDVEIDQSGSAPSAAASRSE